MQANLVRWGMAVAAVVLVVDAAASVAWAGGLAPVPEIDGSIIAGGLGLLSAGVLVLRSRRSR